jgi:hypothetical protein
LDLSSSQIRHFLFLRVWWKFRCLVLWLLAQIKVGISLVRLVSFEESLIRLFDFICDDDESAKFNRPLDVRPNCKEWQCKKNNENKSTSSIHQSQNFFY